MSDCGCKGRSGCECDGHNPILFGQVASGMRHFEPSRGMPNGSGNWTGFRRADQGGEHTSSTTVRSGPSIAGYHVAQAFHTDDGGSVSNMGEPDGDGWLLASQAPHVGFFTAVGRP